MKNTEQPDVGPTYDELIIDRAHWLRGRVCPRDFLPKETCLLNEKGDMCPMGFHMLALGFPEDFILGQGEPVELDWDEADWLGNGTAGRLGPGPAFLGRLGPAQHPQMEPLLGNNWRGDYWDREEDDERLRMSSADTTPAQALRHATSDPSGAIININDNVALDDDERESLLAQLFHEVLNITLIFTGPKRPTGEELRRILHPQGEEE